MGKKCGRGREGGQKDMIGGKQSVGCEQEDGMGEDRRKGEQ